MIRGGGHASAVILRIRPFDARRIQMAGKGFTVVSQHIVFCGSDQGRRQSFPLRFIRSSRH